MRPHSDELLPSLGRAVTYDAGPLAVLGAAGTGKTSAVVSRFLWLVGSRGRSPGALCVVVPSRARADAMRRSLEERLERPYDRLFVLTPVQLAGLVLERGGHIGALDSMLSAGERLALLLERIDELPLRYHDFGGRASALIGGFVRRIDALKAELVGASEFAALADQAGDGAEREFAAVYAAHEQLLRELGARDTGDVVRDALRLTDVHPFDAVLVDDAHELALAAARLVVAVGGDGLTVAADPVLGACGWLSDVSGLGVVRLERSLRCPDRIVLAARTLVDAQVSPADGDGGSVEFWRCANERAEAQSVAADVERLLVRENVAPGEVAVVVPSVTHEGQAVAVALEERAVACRLVGEAAFFRRAEIRDVLAWLRLLADPSDAGAVVRALARPPIDLRSVDIARCTQIARRRKLDMVAALAAALESPQVPPEARERILVFLKLYRSGVAAIDTTRPDLYVHRLIERLGLRRQQLFAAQADVVERLRALARFAELASSYVRRSPQATPREFARSTAAVAEFGLPEQEEPVVDGTLTAVQIVGVDALGGLEAEHVYMLGLDGGFGADAGGSVRELVYGGVSRARFRAVLCYTAEGGEPPLAAIEDVRVALGSEWEEKDEELFGPAETLHSMYRLLRDELLESTMRAGGRLGELRFDTDLDVSHAVVRYLELLKVAALIARPEGQAVREALRDVNARILQAVTAEQREIFSSSALDDYLLDAERDTRRRMQALAARDEPSLEPFLPLRGDGVVLSASDIDTYRTCPLKYKFARIFRIPQEPTIHQRFGILLHQVLERFHAAAGGGGGLPELLGLLDAGWRRGGFADSEEERQLRGKASSSLTRYWERFQSEESQPMWFERQFTFRLGPHLLRGRVDRVDRLPDGEYELIDYKTGRPKSAAQLAEDVQLSLYAVGAREAWSLDSSQQAYYYLLDDEKVTVPLDGGDRDAWVRDVAVEVAEGILGQGFEPTPSFAACSVCDYRLVCPAAER